MSTQDKLQQMHACREAIEWIGDREAETAWKECERGDWMLWIAHKQGIDFKLLTLAKVRCASLVKHLMTDERSLNALIVAERFAKGNASRKALDAASTVANAAANAATYTYAPYAAPYAASASAAACAAANAADAAACIYAGPYAASAVAAAASDAAYAADDRKKSLKQTADICRDTIPFSTLNWK